MNEREPNRLAFFHDEINKIKSNDKTLFALENPENLDIGSSDLWNSLKLIPEFSDPKELINACEELNDKCMIEVKNNQNKDKTEFISWIKNKLAALKSSAEAVIEGNMTDKEFHEEVDMIKASFGK